VLERAAGADADAARVDWPRAEAALFEVGADLHRHLPPAVAWAAAGQALAGLSNADLVG
jgi:hypothetical protein